MSSRRHPACEALSALDRFSDNFDRCFDHLHRYVGRRARDREELERIVGEVLVDNLDLLVERHASREELRRLEEAADTRLKREPFA